MQVLRAEGSLEVARLLRNVADEVEAGSGSLDGRRVGFSGSLKAVVQFPDEEGVDATLVSIRISHPDAGQWDLTRLQQALARPGD